VASCTLSETDLATAAIQIGFEEVVAIFSGCGCALRRSNAGVYGIWAEAVWCRSECCESQFDAAPSHRFEGA
jgi:hypothetical protein